MSDHVGPVWTYGAATTWNRRRAWRPRAASLKELLRYEGANQAATGSPREIIKTAYAYFHFMEEDVWLEMLRDRNDATHIYNEEAAQQLVEKILHQYIGVFVSLEQQIRARYGDEVLEQL